MGDREIAFEKWEGLGNDFVIVPQMALDDADVRAICDRRRGVGGDGVLILSAEMTDTGSSPRMVVRNADGSRPEMCGNGARCAAAYWSRRVDWTAPGEASAGWSCELGTDSGARRCELRSATAGGLYEVTIDMGTASLEDELFVACDAPYGFVTEGQGALCFRRVSVGNPHVVSFDEVADSLFDAMGPIVSRAVAGGTNVEVADIVGPDRIRVRVWERGVGRTDACGTGACAVARAACAAGLASYDRPIEVALPGGKLVIEVSEDGRVRMTGPCRRVFAGTFFLSEAATAPAIEATMDWVEPPLPSEP